MCALRRWFDSFPSDGEESLSYLIETTVLSYQNFYKSEHWLPRPALSNESATPELMGGLRLRACSRDPGANEASGLAPRFPHWF